MVENPRCLQELVGKEIAVTPWLELTHERIQQFAQVTEDHQWIHVDEKRAKSESPYGATIAHGFLVLSLSSYFLKQAIEIRQAVRLAINYGLNRVRFPAAVRANSKIRARVTVLSVRELPDSMEATYSVSVESEGVSKPSCVAEWILRYYT